MNTTHQIDFQRREGWFQRSKADYNMPIGCYVNNNGEELKADVLEKYRVYVMTNLGWVELI